MNQYIGRTHQSEEECTYFFQKTNKSFWMYIKLSEKIIRQILLAYIISLY